MSAGLYRLCRAEGYEPVRLTAEVIRPTSRQVTHHLLCSGCEQRLSRKGERWVIPLLPTVAGAFPLLDRVRTNAPVYSDEEREIFATALNRDVDAAKLIHFALGLFWKASVHSWNSDEAGPVVDLGEYREGVRRFLLEGEDLPPEIALVISLDNAPVRLIGFVEPYQGHGGDFTKFLCFVPGMLMALCIGQGAKHTLNLLSVTASEGQHIQVEELSKMVRNVSRSMTVNARYTEKLLKNRADIDAKGLGIRLGQ
jgi:hypothetical protein